jgi:hypothetical protein
VLNETHVMKLLMYHPAQSLWQSPNYPNGTVINTYDPKYVVHCTTDTKPACLFNIIHDPHETADLASDPRYSGLLSRLLERWRVVEATVFDPDRGMPDPQACVHAKSPIGWNGFFGPWLNLTQLKMDDIYVNHTIANYLRVRKSDDFDQSDLNEARIKSDDDETATQQRPPPLPRLRTNASAVSVSGISSGADFAMYFSVAESKSVMGSAIFAGNVYRCYSTRFPGDQLVNCSKYVKPAVSVAGCSNVDPLQAPCDPSVQACPPGMGLVSSKCQGCGGSGTNFISAVNVSTLLKVAARRAAGSAIDPLTYIRRGRYWLYRGTNDACYKVGSVDHAAAFYRRLGGTVAFVNSTVGSLHSIPTVSDGTPCGTEGNYSEEWPHGLESCNFDGAGEALKHIYGELRPPVPQREAGLHRFDQLDFDFPHAGLDTNGGFVYIPAACESQSMCRLHVFAHGCGMAAYAGPSPYAFNDTYARRAGFNGWAEANQIVVVYPQLHYGERASCAAQKGILPLDCRDQGGSTGEAWADKGGQQVKAVMAMIARLQQSPSEETDGTKLTDVVPRLHPKGSLQSRFGTVLEASGDTGDYGTNRSASVIATGDFCGTGETILAVVHYFGRIALLRGPTPHVFETHDVLPQQTTNYVATSVRSGDRDVLVLAASGSAVEHTSMSGDLPDFHTARFSGLACERVGVATAKAAGPKRWWSALSATAASCSDGSGMPEPPLIWAQSSTRPFTLVQLMLAEDTLSSSALDAGSALSEMVLLALGDMTSSKDGTVSQPMLFAASATRVALFNPCAAGNLTSLASAALPRPVEIWVGATVQTPFETVLVGQDSSVAGNQLLSVSVDHNGVTFSVSVEMNNYLLDTSRPWLSATIAPWLPNATTHQLLVLRARNISVDWRWPVSLLVHGEHEVYERRASGLRNTLAQESFDTSLNVSYQQNRSDHGLDIALLKHWLTETHSNTWMMNLCSGRASPDSVFEGSAVWPSYADFVRLLAGSSDLGSPNRQ